MSSTGNIIEPKNGATLVVNPIGGLANRMRAIASGLALADSIGCDYRIVWRENWEIGARIDDIFASDPRLEGKVIYPGALKFGLLYSVGRKKNLYLSEMSSRLRFGLVLRDCCAPLKDILNDEATRDSRLKDMVDATIARGRDCLLQGGVNMFTFPAETYRGMFRPSDEVRERVEEVVSRLGSCSVGLHIRRSDNKMSVAHSPDELFERAIDEEIERRPDVKFYLATDDEATKRRFAARYGSRLLFSPAEARRGDRAGIIDAAVEMFVLSRTNSIIGSYYSSFSEAAAMLGDVALRQMFKK